MPKPLSYRLSIFVGKWFALFPPVGRPWTALGDAG